MLVGFRAVALIGVVAATVLPKSCSEDDGPKCDHDPPLTWENFGYPFMDQYCLACHSSLIDPEQRNGAPVGIDFDTYTKVMISRDLIRGQTLIEEPTMPPGGGPTAGEWGEFSEWLDCAVDPDFQKWSGQGG